MLDSDFSIDVSFSTDVNCASWAMNSASLWGAVGS